MHLNVYIWITNHRCKQHKTFTQNYYMLFYNYHRGTDVLWLFDDCDTLDSSTCGLDPHTVHHKAVANLHHISLFFLFDLARKIYNQTSPNEIWEHAERRDSSSGSIQTVMGKNREHLRIAVSLMTQLDQSRKVTRVCCAQKRKKSTILHSTYKWNMRHKKHEPRKSGNFKATKRMSKHHSAFVSKPKWAGMGTLLISVTLERMNSKQSGFNTEARCSTGS